MYGPRWRDDTRPDCVDPDPEGPERRRHFGRARRGLDLDPVSQRGGHARGGITLSHPQAFAQFKKRVVLSKLGLLALLKDLRAKDARIYGIGAPSRASTLINYVGLDDV